MPEEKVKLTLSQGMPVDHRIKDVILEWWEQSGSWATLISKMVLFCLRNAFNPLTAPKEMNDNEELPAKSIQQQAVERGYGKWVPSADGSINEFKWQERGK